MRLLVERPWRAPYLRAERHRGNFEKSHYPTVVQVGCKLVMVYSRGFSCCAPRDAQLGVFAATYTIEPTVGEVVYFGGEGHT